MESFIQKFRDFTDCYTIIGGAACDILMSEADTPFRATKDIDMILIMEARFKEFAKTFWEYIIDGGYRFGWKNSEEVHFYRFTETAFSRASPARQVHRISLFPDLFWARKYSIKGILGSPSSGQLL